MKPKFSFDAVLILLLLLVLSCQNQDDVQPASKPFVGTWIPVSEDFIAIYANGEEMTLSQFGREVLGFQEEEASFQAKSYLESTLIGPVFWDKTRMVFFSDGSFSVQKGGNTEFGQWNEINENQTLRLIPNPDSDSFFDFEVKKLNTTELILSKKAELEFLEDPREIWEVEVLIHLKN
ncbi:hypothetical protein [Algoriphagus confluentis]